MRLYQLFMQAKCISCRLHGQFLYTTAVWKLPPGFFLPGAANGTDYNLDLVRTANKRCFLQGALLAEPFNRGLAAPMTDGLHHIRTIWA